ncbi:MAG: hypothetical protein IJZ53_14075 [Tyzzerella sp.]|nr:hypothetical protein [Tyzzerella sp.]
MLRNMENKKTYHIMVLNLGSTSFKYKLFEICDEEKQVAEGGFENVGSAGTMSHMDAFAETEKELKAKGVLDSFESLDAVGYKAVHAGDVTGARVINDEILGIMEHYSVFAPAHNPVYIQVMKEMKERFPKLLQIGYFETSFHASIPEKRVLYGVPYEWKEKMGIRRYGFHGSSHSFMAWKMGKEAPECKKIISFHLGGSSSVCAIEDGESIASSMGATPQSGVFQNNRVGDIDMYCLPGLMKAYDGDWNQILKDLSSKGGLLGVSGISNDLRLIEAAANEGDARANLTLDAYVDNLVGYAGMFDAYLKGADALVFTGGIGKGSSLIRKRVCEELSYKGIVLDDEANEVGNEGRISKPESKIGVYIWKTNEELMVMRQCLKLLQ